MKQIKKTSLIITILLCVLTSIFSLTACGKVAVENVVLDKSTATIKVEETLQLIADSNKSISINVNGVVGYSVAEFIVVNTDANASEATE